MINMTLQNVVQLSLRAVNYDNIQMSLGLEAQHPVPQGTLEEKLE
jgi:hypothetical protein